MKECDVCGTPNLRANNYCTHCGNRIAMDNICPFCGELNSDDSSYCSSAYPKAKCKDKDGIQNYIGNSPH